MEHFDELEVNVKFYVIYNKGKHKDFIKHTKSCMESWLKYYNYEDLQISVSTLKD